MKTIIKLGGLVVLLSFMVFCQISFGDEGEKTLKKEGVERIPARSVEQLKALEGIKENIIEQKQSFEDDLPVTTIPVPEEEKLPFMGEKKPPYNFDPFQKEGPILYEEKKLEYPAGERIRPPEEHPTPKMPELTGYGRFEPFYLTPLYTLRPVRGPVFLRNYQNYSFGSAMTIKRETIISHIGDEEEKKNGTTYTYSIGKNE